MILARERDARTDASGRESEKDAGDEDEEEKGRGGKGTGNAIEPLD